MQIREAIQAGAKGDLEALIARQPRSVRHLLGLSYHEDEVLRRGAARGLGLASRHHPALIQNVIRRLVWAMNDESGTNALSAPAVLQAVADERPELLLPMVPDLLRLATDGGLKEGLSAVLKTIATRCPGEVGKTIAEGLNQRLRKGGGCEAKA